MTSKVNKGHIKNFKIIFFYDFFCLTPNLFKTFQECQHNEDTNF